MKVKLSFEIEFDVTVSEPDEEWCADADAMTERIAESAASAAMHERAAFCEQVGYSVGTEAVGGIFVDGYGYCDVRLVGVKETTDA